METLCMKTGFNPKDIANNHIIMRNIATQSDIAITGPISSGKTLLYKTLQAIIGNILTSDTGAYTCVDEVVTTSDLSFVRNKLLNKSTKEKQSLLFTSHHKNSNLLIADIPEFTGLHILLVR